MYCKIKENKPVNNNVDNNKIQNNNEKIKDNQINNVNKIVLEDNTIATGKIPNAGISNLPLNMLLIGIFILYANIFIIKFINN